MKNKLIDRVTLYLSSGNGGNGICSFRREKFVRKGGPDGGDGGKGGDIIFRVNDTLFTLNHLRYTHHVRAGNGENGQSAKKHGKNGNNAIVEVPPGTVIMDEDGHELMDLLEGDNKFLEGGDGGAGNTHFKSSVNRAPRRFTRGKPGIEEKVILELRLIADVGFVGKPNAGKSTLLKVLTGSNTQIADYPFTTLKPNLGVLNNGIYNIRLADIPGIIEGASAGRGLGLKFLKHIQRVKMLVYVIDISSPDVKGTFEELRNELRLYDKRLSGRDYIILFNKTDLVNEERINEIENMFSNDKKAFSSLLNNQTGGIEQMIYQYFDVKRN